MGDSAVKSARILVVDDEATTRRTLQAYLEQEGYSVHTAADGLAALSAARDLKPDLIVLDIMLPGMDGVEVLRALRKESSVYVLMLTAKADETDKVVGLTMGADDYLTKPYSPRELVARVKAMLRRAQADETPAAPLSFHSIRIDAEAHRVWVRDQSADLTALEFDILLALARHPGRVLSREQLIEQVWGHDYYGDDRVVDVHIGRIRKKLEEDPANPTLIVTVRGAGYRFEDEPA